MTDLDVVRMFAEQKHPRAPKGAASGGEFAPAKQSGKGAQAKKTTSAGSSHGTSHNHAATLSYDPKAKTGAGYGMKGGDPRVHRLQEALNRLGLTDAKGKKLAVDGKLGPLTTEAVKAAQKRLGITADGQVTPALLHRLADAKSLPGRSVPMVLLDERARLTAADINDLPDSAFAYIEPGGHKDADGKTAPRSLRHFPIHDEAHVRNALARAPQSPYGDRAMPKIRAAAKRFGIQVSGSGENSRPDLGLCVRAFDFEARAVGDGRTLEGYAAVFNTPARIADLRGDFEEVIHPGAFARSLQARMPVLQFEHGRDPRVGAVPIGSLQEIREDARGLYVRARLFDNAVVEPVRQAIAERAIKGMSFRFGVPDGGDAWTRRDGSLELREIRDADVHELGPVVFPAYDTTSVSVRSLLAHLDVQERRALVHELAAEVRRAIADEGMAPEVAERLAVDLEDLTGQSDAWSADGGDSGPQPGDSERPPVITTDPQARHRDLLLKGIIRAR